MRRIYVRLVGGPLDGEVREMVGAALMFNVKFPWRTGRGRIATAKYRYTVDDKGRFVGEFLGYYRFWDGRKLRSDGSLLPKRKPLRRKKPKCVKR